MKVVDDRQNAKPSAIGKRVRQKVQAPTVVGACGNRHRHPCSQGSVAPSTPTAGWYLLHMPATALSIMMMATGVGDVEPAITEPAGNEQEFGRRHRRWSGAADSASMCDPFRALNTPAAR